MFWTQFFMNLHLLALVEHVSGGSFNGPLEAAYVGLYKSPTGNLTPASLMAAVTEATYDGYARQLITWFPPTIDAAGPATMNGGALNFTPTGSATSCIATGLIIADALTAGNLLGWWPFPGLGVPLANPTNFALIVPQYQLPFTPTYGTPTLIT